MAKFVARRHRSAVSLMASGVATINIDQRGSTRTPPSISKALRGDQVAIRNDAKRAYKKAGREFEPA